MSQANNHETKAASNQETESSVTSFHRVQSLIPDEQQLATIAPETRVADALALMQKNHFSQLPVIAGRAVLGIFSYRSFSQKALAKQKVTKEWLGELPVEDFLEEFEFVHSAEDWNRVRRYLNQDDAFFVGHRDKLDGMVTTMDVLDYFADVANPFIMLAEIELSLRQIIHTCLDGETLPAAIKKSLTHTYGQREIPSALNEMTFDNYVQIISNSENWPHFEKMFGVGDRTRKQTNQKLKQLGDWRNITFHFKRRLQPWELDTLAEYREWLQRRVRAFEGRQQEAEEKRGVQTKEKRGKTSRPEFTAASDPVAADFFSWMMDQTQERGLKIHWGTKGFSVRKQIADRAASIAYGYPPDIFEIYFSQLGLAEREEIAWRRELLASGVLQEAGERTLRGRISSNTVEQLRKVFSYLLDKVDAPLLDKVDMPRTKAFLLSLLDKVDTPARYPLPIRALVQGKEITAQLLDERGRIRFEGSVYSSPSGAGKAASGWTAVNGWTFWQYYDETSGEWKAIGTLRTSN
jgi:predicted transcriptional regulator